MSERFDAIVIGAGQAGPALAGRLCGAGWRVALVERHLVGGTCVNTGCMPTKTLVASARAAHVVRHAADWGVVTAAPPTVDMATVKARQRRVVDDARAGLERWLGGLDGFTLVRGHARFESPTTVRVGDRALAAPHVFVNVGGRAARPDLPGVRDVPTLDNASLLALDALPRHLVVVGGSYVGLEFAQMYRRFGAEVTVVEKGPRLVAREDEDVSQALREILEAEGVAVRVDATCIGFRRVAGSDDVAVSVDCASGEPEVIGSHVLLAMGRVPNTDDLGLEHAGIAVDAHGFIPVDGRLRTSVEGVRALGECNGRGAFTHTAYDDFLVVADDLLAQRPRDAGARIPCYALFTDPPLGRCGLGAAEARAKGHRVRVGRRPMSRVGRAVEKGEARHGFLKLVVDADSDALLGAAALGPGGDEAVHAVLEAMAGGRTASDLARTMHVHPTVAELWPTLAAELVP